MLAGKLKAKYSNVNEDSIEEIYVCVFCLFRAGVIFQAISSTGLELCDRVTRLIHSILMSVSDAPMILLNSKLY